MADKIVLDCCGRVADEDDDTWGPDSVDDQLAVCAYGHGCYAPM
jgi:hypothetical protein